MCSSDSLCAGVSANKRSICVCPLNKFGSRCLLTHTICQTDNKLTCQNGGQCIPNDHDMISYQNFTCICPTGFSGDQCEIADTKLIVSFDKDIILSQSIFIHFIEVFSNNRPLRMTTFRTIPVRQNSVMIYWSLPFHLVFIELNNKNYYLTVIQTTYNPSTAIAKIIKPSDRCSNISELFNANFVQWHLLRRIKYYHLPCQTHSPDLSCFYDDVHLCVCYDFGQKRLANCFNFDHNMRFDCLGESACENGAQCFQDSQSRSICLCPPCFYGTRCQLSTSGFGLSLDAILGYHIISNVSIIHQPSIIKFSVTLTILFMVAGLINGVLCMITFKNKTVREVGCGLYLLCSSIISLLTMIMFGLKFWIFLLVQQTIISNQSFIYVQCMSFDFVLRVCLTMDQWLHACVTTERAAAAIKDVLFNTKKSKQAAKFIIVILLIVVIGTCIHDPFYRRLFNEENVNDDDQKRIWCIVTYSSSLQVYNYVIYCFHFFGPFIINMISAFIYIIVRSRKISNRFTGRSYEEILREQFQQNKYLLIAPVVLIIFALPRLIIIFVSKCLKSMDSSWFFIVGYFISFIPPMINFIVFILPSKPYRKELKKTLVQYRTSIQRCLHLRSFDY
jgi:hypothetical protein